MKQITNTNTNIIKTASGKTARLISGWTPLKSDRTTVIGESVTVPNMSYEIKDLLTNYSRGIDLIGNQPELTYDEDPTHDQDDISSIGRMDINDQTQLIENTIAQSKKLQQKIKEQQTALAQPLTEPKVEPKTQTQ